ncbi:MAG: ATP-binding cassette domain-containing protein [Thermodesulfobacteriota bacterium]|nr:ATP-binding cassette domain-containing protein [Thermodesulfobacteriota bacterium]
MTAPLIELKNVTKRFGEKTVLDRVNLTIFEGDITTIIGKSGEGKSVLLKHIIGLLRPDEGEILFNGKQLKGLARKEQKSFKQQISYMFQNNALFDSLTVFENIALPLREKTRLDEDAIKSKVLAQIDRMELSEVTDKYPSQISGGMQKRVALARALVSEPKIILFDEPTAGLDPLRKNVVLSMIAHHQKKIRFTAILVSHDIPDVLFISNRVAIIDSCRIPFQGTPMELEQSENPVVQQFIKGQASLKDELTGLNTKLDIENMLIQEMRRPDRLQETFSIVMFTIENLEQINEHVGHIAAQQIIQCLGTLIKDHFDTADTSARYSQNEILMILPHTGLKKAKQVLDELATDLQKQEIFQTKSYPKACFSFSILAGLAEAGPGMDMDSLIGQALSHQKIIAYLECMKHGGTA